MSRFVAGIQGGQKEVTRSGTKNSGISGYVQGWRFGVQINMYVNDEGEDEAHIFLTDGSSRGGLRHFVGTFTKVDLEG